MRFIRELSFLILSIAVVACLRGNEESGPEIQNLTVYYVRSTPDMQAFVDSCIARYAIRHNYRASSKPCTVLELISLAREKHLSDSTILYLLPYEYIPALNSYGAVIALPDSIDDIYAPLEDACFWKGKRVAVPLTCDVYMLFFRGPIVASVGPLVEGIEPDKMMDLRDSYTSEYSSVWSGHGDDPRSLSKTIVSWFGAYGGSIFDDSGKVVVNSSLNKQALTDYADLAKGARLETLRQQRAGFVLGNLAMWYGNASSLLSLSKRSDSIAWMATYISPNNDVSPRPVVHGYAACVNGSYSETNRVISFIMDLRHEIQRFETMGFPSSSAYWQKRAQSADICSQLLAQQIGTGRSMRSHPEWTKIEMFIERAVLDVLYGNNSVNDALDELQKDIEDLVS